MAAPRSSSLRGSAAFVLALAGACRPPAPDLATGEHALSAAQKVSELSTDLSNESSGPAGFQEVNGQMMFFSTAGPLSTGMGLYRSDGTTAGTELVRDLDPRVANFWDVPHIVVLNDRGYWPQAGALWVTDGTAAGTQQVAAFGNAPGLGPTELVVHDGAIFFGAGGSLYRSDGTPAGTQILAASVSPSGRWQEMGGKLYFGCQITSAAGLELCATDGTAAGTVMVKEILPGIQSSDPHFLGVVGSKLLFSAVSNAQFSARGLWSTDGTAAGTQQLVPPPGFSDTGPIADFERPAAILGAQAYLPCHIFLTGFELCKTDGTPAGTSVLDVVPSPGSLVPGSVVMLGSQLVFLASTTAAGVELWTSDGTVAGTKMLVDLLPGPSSGFAGGALFPMGGAVYFSGRATAGDPAELWKTDGTATVRVARLLQPGKPEGAPLFLLDTGVLGTQLFFEADDGVTSLEPWVTDGTGAGTHLLKDLAPTRSRVNVHEAHAYHGDHYLSVGSASGELLWKTDGTTAGTASFQTGQFFALTPVDHWLYYGELNRALWKTDGTTSGTIRVTDLAGDAALFHAFGRLLVYSAGTPNDTHGGLWFSDGTAAGTHLTTPAVLSVDALGIANGRVWCEGFAGSLGNELWTSDGTDAGTRFVKDIRAGSASSTPLWFVELNGQTIFTADDGVSGRELWKTDGTAAGTVRTADINPGSASSNPANFTAWNGMVLFTADAGAGRGLWKTDGTTAGTVLLKAVTPADDFRFVPWGDVVFFAATDTAGTELWRSDGTPAGTVMVGDIYAGPLSSNPSLLVLAGSAGPLVFAAEEPLAGREIWQLAQPLGTPELLADIALGVPSSRPTSIGVEGSSLIVTADDGTGYALWRIDGVGADGTPPVLTCPADVTVMTMNSQGTAVTFSPPTAMDDSGVAPTVTADWASGDVFPVGTTRVNVTATDGSNNTSRCSFVVDVILQNSAPDAGPVDAPPDAGPVDAPPDAGPVDAPPDAGPIQPPPDAGPADAGPDGGNAEVPGEGARGGCGCSAEGATSWPTNALVLALVAVVLLRRPRRV